MILLSACNVPFHEDLNKSHDMVVDDGNCKSISPFECSFDTISVMCKQEGSYKKHDPLHLQQEELLNDVNKLPLHIDIDEVCRDKMCEWSYQIVDFCKFNRESVDIAMNYLDRFILTPNGVDAIQNRNVYQLAAMTSLYSAIKIHERQALSPKVVSQLSRGLYTEDQIIEMESKILHGLQWKLHPPTAFSFVRELLAAIPDHVFDEKQISLILDVSQIQTELAVCDYRFIETPTSLIAFCALMNSLECCGFTEKAMMLSKLWATSIGITDAQCFEVVNIQIALNVVCPSSQEENSSLMIKDTVSTLKNTEIHVRRSSLDESPRTTTTVHATATESFL